MRGYSLCRKPSLIGDSQGRPRSCSRPRRPARLCRRLLPPSLPSSPRFTGHFIPLLLVVLYSIRSFCHIPWGLVRWSITRTTLLSTQLPRSQADPPSPPTKTTYTTRSPSLHLVDFASHLPRTQTPGHLLITCMSSMYHTDRPGDCASRLFLQLRQLLGRLGS